MTSCESAPGIYYLLFTFSVSVAILKIKDWLTFPQSRYRILFVIVYKVLVVFKVIRTLEQTNTKWALIFKVIFSN